MKNSLRFVVGAIALASVLINTLHAQEQQEEFEFAPPPVAPLRLFDPGPELFTADKAGQGYAQVFASVANFRDLGLSLSRFGKFRPVFGPTFYRGNLGKDQVKILVIGQDATHIAEAAGRTFTGGTGGRLQNVVNYLGTPNSGFFMNTFAYTILGQFGDFVPVIDKTSGKVIGKYAAILPPSLYSLAEHIGNPTNPKDPNDPISPVVEWRNSFIDQILDSNRGSIKLIIAVGGAARDTLAAYINSRGGAVPTQFSAEQMKNLQLVKSASVPAGGNHSFTFPVDASGQSVTVTPEEMAQIKSQLVAAAKAKAGPDPKAQKRAVEAAQMEAEKQIQTLLAQRINEPARFARMVPLTNGPFGNGLFNPAQLGYNLDKSNLQGQSLRGLVVRGKPLPDIRFIEVPHPGSLSPTLPKRFQAKLDQIKGFVQQGWTLPPDPGATNQLLAQVPFEFKHAAIPRADFPFGKTGMVISDNSNARRNGPQVIQIGGRDKGMFDPREEQASMAGRPAEGGAIVQPVGSRPWEPSQIFDNGPGEELAQLMTPPNSVIEAVHAKNPDPALATRQGIDAQFVKESIEHGFHGVYRGNLRNSPVLVVADPLDLDDMVTSRALTGATGQALHGFLQSLVAGRQPLGDRYVVLSTMPFDMTGANDSDWKGALEITREWRQGILNRFINPPSGRTLPSQAPFLILTVGPRAAAILAQFPHGMIPVVDLDPTFKNNAQALQKIAALPAFAGTTQQRFATLSIPRTHLPFGMQQWIGTSGNRVIRALGKDAGIQYEFIAPTWAQFPAAIGAKQPGFTPDEMRFLVAACTKFAQGGFEPCPRGGQQVLPVADDDDDEDTPDVEERAAGVAAQAVSGKLGQ